MAAGTRVWAYAHGGGGGVGARQGAVVLRGHARRVRAGVYVRHWCAPRAPWAVRPCPRGPSPPRSRGPSSCRADNIAAMLRGRALTVAARLARVCGDLRSTSLALEHCAELNMAVAAELRDAGIGPARRELYGASGPPRTRRLALVRRSRGGRSAGAELVLVRMAHEILSGAMDGSGATAAPPSPWAPVAVSPGASAAADASQSKRARFSQPTSAGNESRDSGATAVPVAGSAPAETPAARDRAHERGDMRPSSI